MHSLLHYLPGVIILFFSRPREVASQSLENTISPLSVCHDLTQTDFEKMRS